MPEIQMQNDVYSCVSINTYLGVAGSLSNNTPQETCGTICQKLLRLFFFFLFCLEQSLRLIKYTGFHPNCRVEQHHSVTYNFSNIIDRFQEDINV